MDALEEANQTCSVIVNLTDVFDYAAGGSRLVIEGERVFKAGHLLIVGVEHIHQDGFSIFATCLQSSSPSSEPHVIKIRTRMSFKDWTFLCSCKAGRGKCKHLMAVLYHLLKNSTVPFLTVTDLTQKWGKIAAKTASDMYKATRIMELCYCKKWLGDTSTLDTSTLNDSVLEEQSTDSKRGTTYQHVTTDESENTRILDFFTTAFPESSVGYEVFGRPTISSTVVKQIGERVEPVDEFLMLEICDRQLSSSSLSSLISYEEDISSAAVKSYLNSLFLSHRGFDYKYFIGPLEADLCIFYELKVCISARESIDVCLQTLQQNSAKWKEERSLRITASNAYQLYTYYKTDPCKPKDWKRKVTKLILPDDLTTPAIEHGRKCESKAINVYSDATGKTVSRCGLVVPPNVPWIGCSPDGLIIEEKKIVEIKCPLAGKSSSIDDLLPNLAYLTKSTMTLRRTHQYFAQVQLNMYVYSELH